MKKLLIIITTILMSVTTSNAVLASGAWTAKAVPTHIESIRGGGFMIFVIRGIQVASATPMFFRKTSFGV